MNGWKLGWAFGTGQTINNAWSANVVQSGVVVAASNLSWNKTLPGRQCGYCGTLGDRALPDLHLNGRVALAA
jgi:cellulase/cellobiase CelA1